MRMDRVSLLFNFSVEVSGVRVHLEKSLKMLSGGLSMEGLGKVGLSKNEPKGFLWHGII